MRDAFGGSFMIMVFLVFIMIYISFTAVVLNYAKAFKVKNTVIDYMENSEIDGLDSITANQMDEFAKFIDNEIIGNRNYNLSDYNICNGHHILEIKEDERVVGLCHEAGIIIEEAEHAENTEGIYYTVSTYLGWNIGFFDKLFALNGNDKDPEMGNISGFWKISGETRLIVNKD